VVVGQIRAEKNRAKTTQDLWIFKQITALIRCFEEHLAAVEGQIETLIATREALAAQSARLCSVPGIGPAISAALMTSLPELGQLDSRKIAALAGLAPPRRRFWSAQGKTPHLGGSRNRPPSALHRRLHRLPF
jgi:transposase